MIEIAAVCDRATVLREGETVGVVDVDRGLRGRIVELMLGQAAAEMAAPAGELAAAARPADGATPRIAARGLQHGHAARRTSSFDLYPGEVLGVVALEGQGQDELFDILAGVRAPDGGRAAGRRHAGHLPPPGRRHPRGPRVRRRPTAPRRC